MSIAHLRKDYSRASLTETDVDPDPIRQFSTWFQQALEAGIPEANAMSVATVGAAGRPRRPAVVAHPADQGYR
jgi:pyridoxamine 5'-phosphate oxidase